MNHYYEIAALYFKRFEGAQYSPKWSDWRSLGFLTSLVTFFVSIYWRFYASSPPIIGSWLFFSSEVATIVFAMSILVYRHQELLRTLPNEGIEDEQKVLHAKRETLIELTGKPASEFLAALDEIKKVQALEQEHRSRLDPDMLKSFLYFFNLPVWTRLLSLLLAGATILFEKPKNFAKFSLSETLSSPELLSSIWSAVQLFGLLLLLGFVIYVVMQQLLELIALLISTKWPDKKGNTTMLNYLMRDLVRLYTPESKAKPAIEVTADVEQPQEPLARSEDKPTSPGAALIVLALSALHYAWLNSKPPLKR